MMQHADVYMDSNSMQKADCRSLLEEFVPKLQWDSEEVVLDVGCGPGDVTRNILRPRLPAYSSLCGIDISPDLIDHATVVNRHSRLSFKVVDFGSPQVTEGNSLLPTDHFTKIFSFYCLHWISDQEQVMRNVSKLLKPEGEAVLMFLGKITGMTVFKLLAADKRWAPYMKTIDEFIPQYYSYAEGEAAAKVSSMLRSQNLESLLCEERIFTHVYPSLKVLIDSWMAVCPWVDGMPEDLRPKFRDHMTLLTIQHSLCDILPDKSAKISYTVLVVHCRKPSQSLDISFNEIQ